MISPDVERDRRCSDEPTGAPERDATRTRHFPHTSATSQTVTHVTTTAPWISSNAKLGIGPAGCAEPFVSPSVGLGAGGAASLAVSPSAPPSAPSSASMSTGVGGVADGVQKGVKAPLAEPGLMKKRESYSNASNLRVRRLKVSVCITGRCRLSGTSPSSLARQVTCCTPKRCLENPYL